MLSLRYADRSATLQSEVIRVDSLPSDSRFREAADQSLCHHRRATKIKRLAAKTTAKGPQRRQIDATSRADPITWRPRQDMDRLQSGEAPRLDQLQLTP